MKALERMRAIGELAGLSSTEKAVLWALALRADDEGTCWPSHETIAAVAGLTRRGAIKAIHSLIGKSLLRVDVRRTERGRRTSNLYVLNLGPESARAVNHVHPSEPLSSEPRSPLAPVEGCTTFTPVCEPRSPPEGEPRSHDLIREDLITGTTPLPLAPLGESPVLERQATPTAAPTAPLTLEPTSPNSSKAAKSGKPTKANGKSATATHVAEIFAAWADARRRHHPRGREPICDVKRTKRIAERIADGFDIETLKRAAAGIWLCPFNLGENAERREHTEIDLALRDAAHVEKFAALAAGGSDRHESNGDASANWKPPPDALPPEESARRAKEMFDRLAKAFDPNALAPKERAHART